MSSASSTEWNQIENTLPLSPCRCAEYKNFISLSIGIFVRLLMVSSVTEILPDALSAFRPLALLIFWMWIVVHLHNPIFAIVCFPASEYHSVGKSISHNWIAVDHFSSICSQISDFLHYVSTYCQLLDIGVNCLDHFVCFTHNIVVIYWYLLAWSSDQWSHSLVTHLRNAFHYWLMDSNTIFRALLVLAGCGHGILC